MFFRKKPQLPTADTALAGRTEVIAVPDSHSVLGYSLQPPYPEGSQQLLLGLGCFWGAEKRFWSLPGVITTAVGYSAGFTPNPTYEEVCSGQTGHNEVVFVVYDPEVISTLEILATFWASHNPTQGMRQGNDRGTQYRSGIYYFTQEQQMIAESSQQQYQQNIHDQLGGGLNITTEVLPATVFYFAEAYHQQYLAKNPNGYCGLGGLGVVMSDSPRPE